MPLPPRTERNAAEMLLFYEAVTRATRRLTLSYPALDEAAQALSPSPYLQEVERACSPGTIARSQWTDLSPVPAGDEPMSAVRVSRQGGGHGLGREQRCCWPACCKVLSAHAGPAVVAGLLHDALRQDRAEFSRAEGMLSGRGGAAATGGRFFRRGGPIAPPNWNATPPALIAISSSEVLNAEPVEELALEVDYLQRGRQAHEVLAALHRRINQPARQPNLPGRAQPGGV